MEKNEFKVRTMPDVWQDVNDYKKAVEMADEAYVYGSKVVEETGLCVYSPIGEAASELLCHAKKICDYIRDMEFEYGNAPINPAMNHDARLVSCDRLVGWALYNMGYTDQPEFMGLCVEGPTLVNFCIRHGFEKVERVEDLEAGDIVFVRPNSMGYPRHTFIHAGTSDTDPAMHYRYDAGRVERIRSTQPSLEPLGDFMYAYRVTKLPG